MSRPDDPPAAAARLSGASVRFGAVQALDGVDLRVPERGVHALLGVNGAGKSTAIRLLLGQLPPDAGAVRVHGRAVRPGQVPEGVGYLSQKPDFEPWLTPTELLTLHARLVGVAPEAVPRQLAAVGLAEVARRRIGGFSGGMTQRLGLAVALLGDPPLLLLDEPASALDPEGRADVLALVAARGRTGAVLLSSHILADVERVCDTVHVLHEGRLLLTDTVDALRGRSLEAAVELEVQGDPAPLVEALRAAPWAAEVGGEGETLRVGLRDAQAAAAALPALVVEAGLGLRRLQPVVPDIEAAFLDLIQADREGR